MSLREPDTLKSNFPSELTERFELRRLIGKGAAASVFLVYDKKMECEVALKLLEGDQVLDGQALKRFREELQICRSIAHPHLVKAYDLFEVNDTLAFSMEYVDGCDLSRIFKTKPLSFREIDRMFEQILSALGELHKNGIVHRDIKLENVLVGRDGVFKLSDLGLLKKFDSAGLTQTGVLLGTAQYLPPEYITRSSFDTRGDIYAAGLMLYELLSGRRRLHGMPGMQVIEFLLKSRFEIPKLPQTNLPRRYLHIIDTALQVDPDRRFQNVRAMREAFLSPSTSLLGQIDAVMIRENLKMEEMASESKPVASKSNSTLAYSVAAALATIVIMICLR